MSGLLHWIASEPLGQAVGFLAFLSIPVGILLILERKSRP